MKGCLQHNSLACGLGTDPHEVLCCGREMNKPLYPVAFHVAKELLCTKLYMDTAFECNELGMVY